MSKSTTSFNGYRSELECKINTMPGVRKSSSTTMLNFRGGCIGSSQGFVPLASGMVAIPHKTRSRSHAPDVRLEGDSEYARQFRERPVCYSSMDKKPLTTYDPLHYRSRNMIPDIVMPYKNASIVSFDAGMVGRSRKPFGTTNRLYHDGEVPSYVTNHSILCTDLKFKKKLKDMP